VEGSESGLFKELSQNLFEEPEPNYTPQYVYLISGLEKFSKTLSF
jgi:hypothetical protein